MTTFFGSTAAFTAKSPVSTRGQASSIPCSITLYYVDASRHTKALKLLCISRAMADS